MRPTPGDIVELPDGRRLVVITPEQAAQICQDVQLWMFDGGMPEWSGMWRLDAGPEFFRGVQFTKCNFGRPPAIEIDPPKEEYLLDDGQFR